MDIRQIRFEGGPRHGQTEAMRFPFSPCYTIPMLNRQNWLTAPAAIDLSMPVVPEQGRYELRAVREVESGQPVEEYYAFIEAPSWYYEAKLREGKENRALGQV